MSFRITRSHGLVALSIFVAACGSAGATDAGDASVGAGGSNASAGGTKSGMSGSSGQGGAGAGAGMANGGSDAAGGAMPTGGSSGSGGSTSPGGNAGSGGESTQGGSGGSGDSGSSGAAGTSSNAGSSDAGGASAMGGTSASAGTTSSGGSDATGGTSSAGGSGASGSSGTGGTTTCNGGPAEVFGHSATTLYRVDATTHVVTTVGDFNCLGLDGEMIDIALDKTGQMYGTRPTALVKIDKTTAQCSKIGGGSFPNSLSFVPAGTVLPNAEALVGYNGSTYVQIDPTSGAVSTIGDLNSGQLASSGDIVSVINGGTYLTVNGTTADGHDCNDCVVQVDPKDGHLIEVLGDAGFSGVYGLAFWAGIVYGFDDGGDLFSYDVVLKTSAPIPIPSAPSGLSFYGAGSTTCAPPMKP